MILHIVLSLDYIFIISILNKRFQILYIKTAFCFCELNFETSLGGPRFKFHCGKVSIIVYIILKSIMIINIKKYYRFKK